MKSFLGVFALLLATSVSFGQAQVIIDPTIKTRPSPPPGAPGTIQIGIKGSVIFPANTPQPIKIEVEIARKGPPASKTNQKPMPKDVPGKNTEKTFEVNEFPFDNGEIIDIIVTVKDANNKVIGTEKKERIEIRRLPSFLIDGEDKSTSGIAPDFPLP